jgi:hypothetical protein
MPEFPAAAISLGITARTLVGTRAVCSGAGHGADHLFSLDLGSGGEQADRRKCHHSRYRD